MRKEKSILHTTSSEGDTRTGILSAGGFDEQGGRPYEYFRLFLLIAMPAKREVKITQTRIPNVFVLSPLASVEFRLHQYGVVLPRLL
jgi:hypothetical protein